MSNVEPTLIYLQGLQTLIAQILKFTLTIPTLDWTQSMLTTWTATPTPPSPYWRSPRPLIWRPHRYLTISSAEKKSSDSNNQSIKSEKK